LTDAFQNSLSLYKLSCIVSVVAALYFPVLSDCLRFVETENLDTFSISLILPVTDEKINSFNAVFTKEPATTNPSAEFSPFFSPGFLGLFPTTVLNASCDIISSRVFPEDDENLISGEFIFPLTFMSILSPFTTVLASNITKGFDIEDAVPLVDGVNLISSYILHLFRFPY